MKTIVIMRSPHTVIYESSILFHKNGASIEGLGQVYALGGMLR